MPQTKHQNGRPLLIHRSKIVPHPDNPRWIAEENSRRLKASLKYFGLVGELVWNERTGHLVSGHKRLDKMDAMEGTRDYELWVWVIDMEAAKESELLVALNNTNMQGDYDSAKVKELMGRNGVNYENMGFSAAEVYRMYGHSAAGMPDKAVDDLGSQVRQGQEIMDRESARVNERDDPDAHLVFVFRNRESRDECVAALVRLRGLASTMLGEWIQDGRSLLDLLDGDDTTSRLLLPGNLPQCAPTNKTITFIFSTPEAKLAGCDKLGLEHKRFFDGDEFFANINVSDTPPETLPPV